LIKTLHTYISRELAKVTVLALVAFTLVLTVFAIVEPLREQGLAGEQVLALFGYTLPVMLSLTLPIGALFAATIVYGRFSQDNELLACRASGISTLSLLKPALILALIVTVVSLLLSNFVAPGMAERAGRAVKANIRGIAYNQLRSRKYIEGELGGNEEAVIHADHVDMDKDILYGVVAVHVRKTTGLPLIAASQSTEIRFIEREDESYVAFDALYVSGGGFGGLSSGTERRQPFPPIKIPNPAKEKPSWYPWGKLVGIIRDPQRDPETTRRLARIRREIAQDLFSREVTRAINRGSGGGSIRLTSGERSYMIRAGSAELGEKGKITLSSQGDVAVWVVSWAQEVASPAAGMSFPSASPDAPAPPASAAEWLISIGLPTIIVAERGEISTDYDRLSEKSVVNIELGGGPEPSKGVFVMIPGRGGQRRMEWVTRIGLPARIDRQVRHVNLENVREEAIRLGSGAEVLSLIKGLEYSYIPSLMGKLIGEMHGRIAYGVSCFALVALGAALGLIFRGGQLISAFATSTLPAAAVIVMVLMGKELAHNSQVPLVAGLSVIWGGVAGLAAVCVVVYMNLCRK